MHFPTEQRPQPGCGWRMKRRFADGPQEQTCGWGLADEMIETIPQRVHLVGIGGAHMSAIARILLSWGREVSGSDLRATAVTEALTALGARVAIGPHDAGNVRDVDLVVTTSAATAENPELIEAQRRGIAVIKRAEMVGRLMQGKIGVGIAGCHGKSTTSGLVAYILAKTGRDPSYLIGAEVTGLGTNAAAGGGPHIVVEADEYDRAFLSYHPQVALVTNVEADHLDYYGTWEAVQEAFAGFAANVPAGGTLVLCASNAEAMKLREDVVEGVTVMTYGIRERQSGNRAVGQGEAPAAPDWAASEIEVEGLGQSFMVSDGGKALGRMKTALPIRHNVENALGAIVVCRTLGLSLEEIAGALASYRGVRRRFEPMGEVAGVAVFDDYAHHPTEIADTAAAAKAHFPGRRIVALFQPHTYARTRYLLEGFKRCFREFDALYILETYAAREAIADGMTGAQLAAELHEPEPGYFETFEAAAEGIAAALRPGDVFFTVGAGDVDSVGPMVLERLRARGVGLT
jgi:UDP-N-acetylmuramate--alanine ligase